MATVSDPPDDVLLPVLVAELADASAREQVLELAAARAIALVPLVDPPVDASLHVLEVTIPGQDAPLLVLAEPVGAPVDHGFPLRLHPYGDPPRERTAPSHRAEDPDRELPSLRATRTREPTLTRHHTRDLLGDRAPETPKATDVTDLVGREIAGKLVVEGLVGVGGMGAVYRARHKQLGTKIALKVLHEKFRDDLAFCARFHAEALVVSQLDHANAVRILDYGQEPDGLLYIAMDFLSGVELSETLKREGTLPLPRIVDLALQVAAGLGHAHARGIVHRDVKPSNIVLVKADDDEGHPVDVVKVCDFGIAARVGQGDQLGTPAYMSPEQCAGDAVDGRSDVYSLGVILYELSTGQLPFSSDDPLEVVRMQLEDEPPSPSRIRPVDARLEALILRMLAKDPARRPASMRDLRTELRVLLKAPALELHDVGTGRKQRDSAPPAGAAAAPPPILHASVSQMPAVVDVPALAMRLLQEPVSTLRDLLSTPERFVAQAQALAAAMRLLLETKELAALGQVLRLLEKVAGDPAGDVRAQLAARLVRTLQDPQRLAQVADRALAEHDEIAPALLAHLGLAAAHALYAARLRVHATPPARGRFVAAMRAIGDPAWPLLTAMLQQQVPGDAEKNDPRLVEDLLRSLPLVEHEGAGAVIARHLRWGDAGVRRAALAPLVASWRDRARPLLLGVLSKDTDEGARVASVKGLCDLGAIDEHVVRKADEILQEAEAGTALKIALADALAETNLPARPLAEAALRKLVLPKGGMFGKLRSRGVALPPTLLLALARAFAGLGGAEAARAIEELGRQSEEPLRTQLLGVIGARLG